MSIITIILLCLVAYGAIGLLFAIPFVVVGLGRVDSAAELAGPAVRLLLVPGTVAVWPLMLRRWMAASRQNT